MSRKLLIGWCLMPFSTLFPFFVFAQEEPSVAGYFLFYHQNKNFSVQAWIPHGNVFLSSHNQFLLKELCTTTVSGSYNIKGNAVALGTSHFGYAKYGMLTISSGYAKLFAKRISFGLQLHYLMHHAENFPKKHSFTFDLSLYGKISQKAGIGISAYNPANLKYGVEGKERIPMLYTLMLDYKISDKVLLAITASKQLPGFFDIAVSICFREKFYGFIMDLSLKKVDMQFSFWWGKWQFDAGGSFDYRVGFSPRVGIGWFFLHADDADYQDLRRYY